MITGTRHFSRLQRAALLCALLAGAMAALPAWAAWPAAPVKIVVPYAPGGPGDMLGRLAASILEKSYQQTFYVENRPGAGGAVAALAVSKATPDGQTLLLTAIGSLAIGPAYADPGYHPLRDFSHIALLGSVPIVLVVNPNLPVRDVKSFIAHASADKSGINWGSVKGTLPQLMGVMFVASAGLGNAVHVGYKGDAPVINDMLGGHIHAAFMSLGAAREQIKAGNFRALAISTPRRNGDFKDLPTFAELGYPQLTAAAWFCLSAPGGLPPDVMEKLSLAVRKGFRQPEARKMLMSQDMDFPDLDPVETGRFIEAEMQRWKSLVHTIERTPGATK